ITLKLLERRRSCWTRLAVRFTEVVTRFIQRLLYAKHRVVGFRSSTRARCNCCRVCRSFSLCGRRFLFLRGPYRRPRSSTIYGAIDSEVCTEVDDIRIARVLEDRVRNETRRHAAHRRTPALTVVIADKQKSTTRRCVYRRSINSIWCVAVGENRISETAAVSGIHRSERFSTIIRDHDAVVIRSDVDHVWTRRMNRDRIDFELSRGSHHPRVGVATFVGAPEAFRRAGEDGACNGRVLKDGSRSSRLRRNALHLAPALTRGLTLVDTAARRSDDVVRIARIDVDRKDVGIVDHSVSDRLPRLTTVE